MKISNLIPNIQPNYTKKGPGRSPVRGRAKRRYAPARGPGSLEALNAFRADFRRVHERNPTMSQIRGWENKGETTWAL